MEKRRIGSLEVSVVGLGCLDFGSRIDEARAREVVHAALDSGINFFDTADIYGMGQSEELLGRALAGRRADAIIGTKFGTRLDEERYGARPDYIRRAVEDSLRRLGTDHIDLYQLHIPDPEVPIEETLGALDELVRAGKVREIGCSNLSAAQLREADGCSTGAGKARFVSVQNEYSLLHREPEAEVLPECERLDIAFIPYWPLASGLLTGRHRRGEPAPAGTRLATATSGPFAAFLTDENLARAEALRDFAEARNRSLLDLAFSWLLTSPAVASVIAGASRPEQIRSNATAAGWRLSPDELEEINRIVPPAR